MKKLMTYFLSLTLLAFVAMPVSAAQNDAVKSSQTSQTFNTQSSAQHDDNVNASKADSDVTKSRTDAGYSTTGSGMTSGVSANDKAKSTAGSTDKDAKKSNQMSMNLDKARGHERISQVIGMNVQNDKGESLGSIHDAVVDKDGKIVYLILSHGGFLGIGDKLVPIPWNQVAAGGHLNVNNNNHLVLSMSKDQLEKAPNFESKNWPNFSEGDWGKKVSGYYHSDRSDNQAYSTRSDANKAASYDTQADQGKSTNTNQGSMRPGYTETR